LLASLSSFSQKKPASVLNDADYISAEDSIAIINELKEEMKLLFGKEKKSFGEISAGLGTGYFSPNDVQQTSVPTGRTFYKIAGGYYHKSGFGIELQTNFMNDLDRLRMFQSAVSPSYVYSKHKRFSAGASYTRYKYADSLSFYTTPLTNEFQVFVKAKKLLIQPTLSFNYAYGTNEEYIPRQGNDPAVTITEKVSDFAFIASLKHDFVWTELLDEEDGLRLTPTLVSIAGTSKYGANFAFGSVSKIFNNLNVKPKKKKTTTGNNTTTGGTTVTEESTTGFKFQSVALILGGEYLYKSYFIQPQVLLDYSFGESGKLSHVFNITLGMTL
jgi:hypothetical protein